VNACVIVFNLRRQETALQIVVAVAQPLEHFLFPAGDFEASFFSLKTSLIALREIPQSKCAEVIQISLILGVVFPKDIIRMSELDDVLGNEPLKPTPARPKGRVRPCIEEPRETIFPALVGKRTIPRRSAPCRPPTIAVARPRPSRSSAGEPRPA
jgi:hypothetical protein